ncbi:MAG: NAD+ synthase [Bdellovibrionales bacterium]
MTEVFSVAFAQLNPVMGDLAGNVARIRKAWEWATAQGADLLMTSELALCGYPPEDLVLKPSFQDATRAAAAELARLTEAEGAPAILLGAPWREDDGALYNAALLLDGGHIVGKAFKRDLPNYGPFDEKRVFAAAGVQKPIDFRGIKLGVMICEDMWTPEAAKDLQQAGAQILLIPNGSPYEHGKGRARMELARRRVAETGLPLVYVNQIGGQDELVFDGGSFVLDAQGVCVAQARVWETDRGLVAWRVAGGALPLEEGRAVFADNARAPEGDMSEEAAVYHALMLGLRDYVNKNAFNGVVLGLSGGIDSALAALLAVDAVGADRVWTAMLPSPYTSDESREDATKIAMALGCFYDEIPIHAAMEAFEGTLGKVFHDREAEAGDVGLARENIQARARGVMLMALSNAFGPMVISTGNKSEMSVGYSTLYGDLCGGFAVLKDVYKTQVYKITRWRNANKPATALGPPPGGEKGDDQPLVPERVFTKAPTAELRPNQKDQDSLPPYEVLDAVLECLIERDMGLAEIVAQGHDAALVARVAAMLDKAEYKRRQAPPGVKITRRHLGIDRRYPITNKYRER